MSGVDPVPSRVHATSNHGLIMVWGPPPRVSAHRSVDRPRPGRASSPVFSPQCDCVLFHLILTLIKYFKLVPHLGLIFMEAIV